MIFFNVGDIVKIKHDPTQPFTVKSVARSTYSSELDIIKLEEMGYYYASALILAESKLTNQNLTDPSYAEHSHVWETYTGLMEVFEHCKACGLKKSEAAEQETEFLNPFMVFNVNSLKPGNWVKYKTNSGHESVAQYRYHTSFHCYVTLRTNMLVAIPLINILGKP